jgi:hypothetical protein
MIKYFNLDSNERLKPFLSTGIQFSSTLITATTAGPPQSSANASLVSTGIFFEGGAYYKLSKSWRVGAGIRMVTGSSKDDIVKGMAVHSNGNPVQPGLMVGYEW